MDFSNWKKRKWKKREKRKTFRLSNVCDGAVYWSLRIIFLAPCLRQERPIRHSQCIQLLCSLLVAFHFVFVVVSRHRIDCCRRTLANLCFFLFRFIVFFFSFLSHMTVPYAYIFLALLSVLACYVRVADTHIQRHLQHAAAAEKCVNAEPEKTLRNEEKKPCTVKKLNNVHNTLSLYRNSTLHDNDDCAQNAHKRQNE